MKDIALGMIGTVGIVCVFLLFWMMLVQDNAKHGWCGSVFHLEKCP